MANGSATAYAFLAFQQDGKLDNFMAVAPVSVGVTMASTPKIALRNHGGSGKRGSEVSSTTSSKKGKTGLSQGSGDPRLDLLVRMNVKTDLADKRFTIDQLRHQISTEDTSLLNHQEAMRKCRKEVRLEKKEMEEGGNSNDQYYRQAVEKYEEAMKSVTKISRRIETLHEELHLCK